MNTTSRVRICVLLVAVMAPIAVGGCASGAKSATSTTAAQDGPARATATAMVEALGRHDFAAATSAFDATMKTGLSSPMLATVWGQLESANGAFQRITATSSTTTTGIVVVHLVTQFATNPRTLEVAVSADGKVGGFHVVA